MIQALEDGEDIQELTERARDRKDRRATNKLLKDAEASNRGTPASDSESRSRKNKKGKSKAPDYEVSSGSKRKRGVKSMSVTPSVNDDDDDEPEQVSNHLLLEARQLTQLISRSGVRRSPPTATCPHMFGNK